MTEADGRQAYSAEYAASHGRFAVVPAAYVFLLDDGRVLLQLRAGTGYYDGWWGASAAGHVEAGESVLDAAVRESAEEIGVAIAPDALAPLTTMHRTGPSGTPVDQRVDFFFACREWSGEPALLEPKAEELALVRPRTTCPSGRCTTSGSCSTRSRRAGSAPSRRSASSPAMPRPGESRRRRSRRGGGEVAVMEVRSWCSSPHSCSPSSSA